MFSLYSDSTMLKMTFSNLRRNFVRYCLLQFCSQFFNIFIPSKLMITAFQCRFNNGEGEFDWIVVGRVGWKEFEFAATVFD